MSWIISLPCTRSEAEALSGELPELDALADAPVVVTREIDEATGRWQLDAYVETRPGAALLTILHALAPRPKGVQPTNERSGAPPCGTDGCRHGKTRWCG